MTLPPFPIFFHALWNYDPFPWQTMLATRISAGAWPQALDLPTASGKTACMDVAIHALASQCNLPLAERTAPRRIWFVVDRRIVVDEAYDRAQAIADKLAKATDGPLKVVADRLRQISGTERPLAVARLRGGVFRDDGWARLPSQPAIITSTVDQVGSRLLFRGYGHSSLTASIFAGLVANDSLILLDEAHCSVPFLQTLRAVAGYRGPKWAENPLSLPFAPVVLSATPPADIPADTVFPGAEREKALDHPVLRQRMQASKPAELVLVKSSRVQADDPLVDEAIERVKGYLDDGKRRMAVMVNRVHTAQILAIEIRQRMEGIADVVLLTGRIRPFERDGVVERWKPYLRASRPDEPNRPVVVVCTQCLEVGADFSFDALITEAASLDALRQRFGRLARMGSEKPTPATIVARESDITADQPDPIYGLAAVNTWQWLCENAGVQDDGKKVIDFGIEAFTAKLITIDDLSEFLAPTVDAPILLPAHLDLLCETAPAPAGEPDVSLYLHGRHGPPEAQVIWRCDLSPESTAAWLETVALCPPTSGEMLSVPLWRLRRWLTATASFDGTGDIEGIADEPEENNAPSRPCLIWRGRDRSKVGMADDIAAGDIVVVPSVYGIEELGQAAVFQALGRDSLDLWEPARTQNGTPVAVRLNRDVLAPWLSCPPLGELLAAAEASTPDRDEIDQAINAVLAYIPENEDAPPSPPTWWLEQLRKTRNGSSEGHPAGGAILFARAGAEKRHGAEADLFADDDDLTSVGAREVSLEEHTRLVRLATEKLAKRCLPDDLHASLGQAAKWHDVGKIDDRFQVLLHHGDEIAAASAEAPLAKSALIPASPSQRQAMRSASGLPEQFRHEMLSVQLAETHGQFTANEDRADLILHLIASHHGYARPFAPVCTDPSPPRIVGHQDDRTFDLPKNQRASLPPPHRVDSGLADRFWRLNRQYGWWGLAYIEAILRLADWYGSTFIMDSNKDERAER
jgi:CRISPR-associated endonuclease/helicase Cas3